MDEKKPPTITALLRALPTADLEVLRARVFKYFDVDDDGSDSNLAVTCRILILDRINEIDLILKTREAN